MNSQNTPITSSLRASYRCLSEFSVEKIPRNIENLVAENYMYLHGVTNISSNIF